MRAPNKKTYTYFKKSGESNIVTLKTIKNKISCGELSSTDTVLASGWKTRRALLDVFPSLKFKDVEKEKSSEEDGGALIDMTMDEKQSPPRRDSQQTRKTFKPFKPVEQDMFQVTRMEDGTSAYKSFANISTELQAGTIEEHDKVHACTN